MTNRIIGNTKTILYNHAIEDDLKSFYGINATPEIETFIAHELGESLNLLILTEERYKRDAFDLHQIWHKNACVILDDKRVLVLKINDKQFHEILPSIDEFKEKYFAELL